MIYASTGKRFVAFAIDLAILLIVSNVLSLPFLPAIERDFKPWLGAFKALRTQSMTNTQFDAGDDTTSTAETLGDPTDLLALPIPKKALFIIFCLTLFTIFLFHAYFIYYETRDGASPGKKLLGLRVISADGRPLLRSQVVRRDVMRWYVDALVFPALIAMISNARRQRVGDLWAGTIVVEAKSLVVNTARPRRAN